MSMQISSTAQSRCREWNRRDFVGTLGAAAFASLFPPVPETERRDHPNIIVILADDLGFGDTGCYGASALATPAIDRMAREGIRFTHGYATAATCTPSRYSLLTGRYPWRNAGAHVLRGDAPLLIDPGMRTLPAMLQKAGYHTGVVGKWHLGLGRGAVDWNNRIRPGPNEIGFDESFIIPATNDRVPTVYVENGRVAGLKVGDPLEVSYRQNFPGEPTGRDNPELLTRMKSSDGHDQSIHLGIGRIGYMRGGEAALWDDETMAETLLEKALSFIDRNRRRPFFLYYALHQPHVPRVPSPRYRGRTGLGPRGDVILEADACVGRLLDKLDELKLSKNTLVVFSSDNGPVLDDGYMDESAERNGGHRPGGPLRGGKYSLYQAGTRVPFLVRWPGRVKPSTSTALVSQVDLFASLASLTGRPLPQNDSQNLLPALLGQTDRGRDELVIEGSGGKIGLRQGTWVLLPPYPGPAVDLKVNIELGNAPEYQLYDLSHDEGEQTNLAEQYPVRVKRMAARLAEIRKSSLDDRQKIKTD